MQKSKIVPVLYLLLIISMALRVNGQKKNDVEMRMLNSPYHAVKVSSGIILNIISGTEEKVMIKASNTDYRNKIKTIVENDTLKIFFYYKDDPNWKGLVDSKEIFNVSIYTKDIKYINIAQGSIVKCQDQIITDTLNLDIITGAQMIGNLQCKKLFVNIHDGSNLKLTGEVTDAYYNVKGASEVDSHKLKTANCKAIVYSASKLRLYVTEKLDITAQNRAKVFFSGNPAIISKVIVK